MMYVAFARSREFVEPPAREGPQSAEVRVVFRTPAIHRSDVP